MEDDYREPSVCDDCEIGDGWECQFCCNKCYEDYGECPNPDCDPMDIWPWIGDFIYKFGGYYGAVARRKR